MLGLLRNKVFSPKEPNAAPAIRVARLLYLGLANGPQKKAARECLKTIFKPKEKRVSLLQLGSARSTGN